MAGQVFQMGLLRPAFALARSLQPATLVLEDIDLIAEERTMPHSHPQLYELLDQMDGLHEDADVMFLLTTNRPDVLEPALASRPGRIDPDESQKRDRTTSRDGGAAAYLPSQKTIAKQMMLGDSGSVCTTAHTHAGLSGGKPSPPASDRQR